MISLKRHSKKMLDDIKFWAATKRFKLTIKYGEKERKKEECYITSLFCNKYRKTRCDFQLHWKRSSYDLSSEILSTDDQELDGSYRLSEWTNFHNHQLDNVDARNTLKL